MDDRETVAAIVAGDLNALGHAYDQYAESLYGYCHWMLAEPADAADALQDTFVVAAGMLDGIRDPRKLRPWLYAVARNECHRRLRSTEVGLDESARATGPFPGTGDADRAELHRQVRAALSTLSPSEREVLELDLRHDLHGADLAAVLGVSRRQSHTLAVCARARLDKALGALLVARTGRRACGALSMLLADWDGKLSARTRKQVSRHADQCEICDNRRRGALRIAVLFGMAPLAGLPGWLRDDVLGLCADTSQLSLAYRQEVMLRAGPFGENGFPQVVRQPRQRALTATLVAAAAAIVIVVVSAGIIAALALSNPHPTHSLDAVRASSGSATSSAAGTADPPVSAAGVPSATSEPTAAPAGQDPAAPSTSATTTKPSPSHSATATPSPSRIPFPTPTPTPTPTATATPTPTVTPTPTPTFTFP